MGTISSYDGFTRTLDVSENSYSFNIYDRADLTLYQAAVMQYTGPQSMVYFRDYMMSEIDWQHYYVLSNGEVRTAYVDVADGISKEATENFYVYASNLGCAEVLMQAIPVYVAEELSVDAAAELAEKGVYSIYCEDGVIKYNDADLVLADVLSNENITYTSELVE